MNEKTPMPVEEEQCGATPGCGPVVTSFWVDGNSFSAAAVEKVGGEYRLLAAKSIESDVLLERIDRTHHPIFMEADYLELEEQAEAFERVFRAMLAERDWPKPFVGVFPAGLVHAWRRTGARTDVATSDRLGTGLRHLLGSNPYLYPRLIEWSEEPSGESSKTVLWASRFDDIAALGNRYGEASPHFDGLIGGRRALEEVLRLFQRADPDQAITLVEAGKLWTHYTSIHQGRVLLNHAIPVGLARDDSHYYLSLTPTVKDVRRLSDQLGTLLYPPDATPSPLFDPRRSSPQVDSTRFALQVARYASRVDSDVRSEFPDVPPLVFYLSGTGSRLPGLRDYLEAKTEMKFRRFDRRRIPNVQLAPGLTWSQAADHIIPLGAAIAYFNAADDPRGMVLKNRRPQPLPMESVKATQLSPGHVYVVDGPPFQRA